MEESTEKDSDISILDQSTEKVNLQTYRKPTENPNSHPVKFNPEMEEENIISEEGNLSEYVPQGLTGAVRKSKLLGLPIQLPLKKFEERNRIREEKKKEKEQRRRERNKRRNPDEEDPDWVPERRSKRLEKKEEQRREQKRRMMQMGLIRQERYWNEEEKKTLLDACKEFGTKDWQKIVERVPTKSADIVRNLIVREKKNQNYTVRTEFRGDDGQVTIIDDGEGRQYRKRGIIDLPDAKPKGKIVEITKRRERNAPIEQWISIIESNHAEEEGKLKEAGTDHEQSANYSPIMPNMLRWIAELEDHPDPAECGGVDYAAIYRWLALLCEGEAPPDLDPVTSLRVSRLLPMLVTILEGTDLTRETEYLTSYRGPFTKFRSSESTDSLRKDAQNLEQLSVIPGLNPLGFPVEFFSKREISNLNEVMEEFNKEIVVPEQFNKEIEVPNISDKVSSDYSELSVDAD